MPYLHANLHGRKLVRHRQRAPVATHLSKTQRCGEGRQKKGRSRENSKYWITDHGGREEGLANLVRNIRHGYLQNPTYIFKMAVNSFRNGNTGCTTTVGDASKWSQMAWEWLWLANKAVTSMTKRSFLFAWLSEQSVKIVRIIIGKTDRKRTSALKEKVEM